MNGVLMFEYTFMKYLKLLLKMALFCPNCGVSFVVLPLEAVQYTAVRIGLSWLEA